MPWNGVSLVAANPSPGTVFETAAFHSSGTPSQESTQDSVLVAYSSPGSLYLMTTAGALTNLPTPPGGFLNGRLATGRDLDGRAELFGIGSDSVLYHTYQTSVLGWFWSSWEAFQQTAGATGAAQVQRNTDGRLEVITTGGPASASHIWQEAPNSGWADGAPLAGALAAPVASSLSINADGRLEAFLSTSGPAVFHAWQQAASVGPWSPLVPL